jgi:hypothetical protein
MTSEAVTPQTDEQLSIAPLPTTLPGRLALVSSLFRSLDEAGVDYCHWKSNEHLAAGAAGRTDLDVLVARRHQMELQRILAMLGLKRFATPPLRAYPAVEDYIGFDHGTGRLAHLHLHFELTLGERYLKGYRLPWEARILASRRRDREQGIYVADPAFELLLLLVRSALKLRIRDRLRQAWAGPSAVEKSDFERELAWLQERVAQSDVLAVAHDLLGPACLPPLKRLLATPMSARALAEFAAVLRPSLSVHRTYGRFESALRVWARELNSYADAVNRRYLHRPVPLRRISPRGGTIIALVGSDGAGKSTLSRSLQSWLGWKIDVMPIYFGSGDGHAAFYRQPLLLAHRAIHPLLGRADRSDTAAEPAVEEGVRREAAEGKWRAAARIVWALALSLEKRGKLRRMSRARNRGMVVICDRYPQFDFPGFNDGPLLAHWRQHRWQICRRLAAWEAVPYIEAGRAAPDIVIRLVAAPAVVSLRRPDMSRHNLERRVEAVKALRFSPTTRVIELDAAGDLDEIALDARRHVWSVL